MNPRVHKAFAVLDSNFLVGYCVKELDKIEVIEERLITYAEEGRELYIPGIAIGETSYIICSLFENRTITKAMRDESLNTFADFSSHLNDSPNGDISLIQRTIAIRASYGPNRSYDAVFVALAEQLTEMGDTRFTTFDRRAKIQANAHAPSVTVDLLIPKKS